MKTINFLGIIALSCAIFISCAKKQDNNNIVLDNNQVMVSDEVADDPKNDWDVIIDEYDSLVENYIVLLRKVSTGDLSVIVEMEPVFESIEALDEKISAAEDVLTDEQLNRYFEVVEKMTTAAAEAAASSFEESDDLNDGF